MFKKSFKNFQFCMVAFLLISYIVAIGLKLWNKPPMNNISYKVILIPAFIIGSFISFVVFCYICDILYHCCESKYSFQTKTDDNDNSKVIYINDIDDDDDDDRKSYESKKSEEDDFENIPSSYSFKNGTAVLDSSA